MASTHALPGNLEIPKGDHLLSMSVIQPADSKRDIIAEDSVQLDALGRSVTVQIGAISYNLTANGPTDRPGIRTFFAIFFEDPQSHKYTQVESIASPLRLRVDNDQDYQFRNERSALKRAGERITQLGKLALRRTGFIVPLASAANDNSELYESTAPGVSIQEAMHAIKIALNLGHMSQDEAAFILSRMHDSARTALDNFHSLGLVHGHPHMSNLNVDPSTGDVHIFDYTLAMENGQDTAVARPGWVGMNSRSPDEDTSAFESRWNRTIGGANLSHLPKKMPAIAESDRQQVIGKLQRAVILTAIARVTNENPSEQAIDRCIQAQRNLISNAPTVIYPHAA